MTVDAAERLPDSRRRLFSSVNLLTRMTSRRFTGWESLSLLTSDQEQLQIYSPVYLIRALCGWHSCHPPPPSCETNLFNPGCSGDHPLTHPLRPPLSAKRSAWISAWRSAPFSSLPESITGSWRNGNWSGGGTPVLAERRQRHPWECLHEHKRRVFKQTARQIPPHMSVFSLLIKI